MKPPRDSDLELRGKLIRSLGSLREMLPGSFVERKRACGRPNCHCADGKNLHSQFQISVLIEGQPRVFNVPAQWAERVREKTEMRRRFEAAAASICSVNLKRFLKQKEDRQA
jgi:gluconate kinase